MFLSVPVATEIPGQSVSGRYVAVNSSPPPAAPGRSATLCFQSEAIADPVGHGTSTRTPR